MWNFSDNKMDTSFRTTLHAAGPGCFFVMFLTFERGTLFMTSTFPNITWLLPICYPRVQEAACMAAGWYRIPVGSAFAVRCSF